MWKGMWMYNVQIARKVCATCKWWRADRELEFSGAREPRYVVVDGIAPGGHPCAAWNTDRSATATCNRWVKWERM